MLNSNDMVKNERLRLLEEAVRLLPTPSTPSLPSARQKFLTRPTIIPRRIDPCAIDISSIKGRFAWEKIILSDTYMPVIFRYVMDHSITTLF